MSGLPRLSLTELSAALCCRFRGGAVVRGFRGAELVMVEVGPGTTMLRYCFQWKAYSVIRLTDATPDLKPVNLQVVPRESLV